MIFRIKTLAEIGEQRDRIADYLCEHGRIDEELKIYEIYNGIFGRILNTLGVETLDDDTLEWVCEEPLIVCVSY